MILLDDINAGEAYGRLGTASTAPPRPNTDNKDRDIEDLEGSTTSVELEAPPPRDPNIVDWEGLDDPANPHNWSQGKKVMTVALVSSITFVTYVSNTNTLRRNMVLTKFRPLASSIFSPSIKQVMVEFNSTNQELASFIVSVYLLGYCFGPLVVSPLSEMFGKNPIYNVCNVLFVVFNVACAKAPDLPSLIIFRLLAGLAGCCPLTLGAGTLTDIIAPEHRGAAMASWAMGPLMGPVIGPIGRKMSLSRLGLLN